jgi:hypothetical protein
VLSQAYATLHAEYVALKSSSHMGDAGYPPQYEVAYGAPPSMAALNHGGGVDPLEMDSMFVYPDLNAGYTL